MLDAKTWPKQVSSCRDSLSLRLRSLFPKVEFQAKLCGLSYIDVGSDLLVPEPTVFPIAQNVTALRMVLNFAINDSDERLDFPVLGDRRCSIDPLAVSQTDAHKKNNSAVGHVRVFPNRQIPMGLCEPELLANYVSQRT